MPEIVSYLDATLESDAILTNGAGNYSGFLHRFYKFKEYGTQLAPTSGSMGYGTIRQLDSLRLVPIMADGCVSISRNVSHVPANTHGMR